MAKLPDNTKNEFRYNRNTKHMNYIFLEKENKFKAIGLTTNNETFGRKNMPLKVNAQKNKTEQSYVRNGIISEKINNYGPVDNRFSFSSEDFPNVKSKIRNYKNRIRKKK